MYKYRYGWTACVAGALALGGAQTAARAADRAVSPAAVPDAASDATSAPDAAPPPLASTPKRDIYAGDYLIIGVGAAVLPAYEGSHQHHVIPAFGLGGRIHGIGISPRSAGLALNIIPPRHSRIGLGFGPVIRYRGSRTVAISDPTPIRVGRGKGYLELGVNASISLKHVFSKYDSLSLGIDARWDASRGTGSRVLAPGLNYQSPVSKGQIVGISASADFINGAMANQTYTVSPTNPVTGTPVPPGVALHSGLRSVGGRIFTAYDLDHDLRNGGVSILFGIGYSRLVNTAGRSPLVTSNGTHDQVVIGSGLAFAFRTRR
jgi:outer membrane protein